MKCISKKIICLSLILSMLALCGCGTVELEDAYDPIETSTSYGLGTSYLSDLTEPFSSGLAIISDNIYNSEVDDSLSEAAGIFSLKDGSCAYAKNVYEQLYPASTTKILTAYLVVENCDNLDDTLTVSSDALNLEYGSSTCGFNVGDVVTVRDALYGMMLCSGNEAANALAEYIAGDIDSFAEMMNEKAQEIGATNSHFVNANGLTDESHYVSAYDMYLIFRSALANEEFYNIVTSTSYTANYTASDGSAVTQEWTTTNGYLTGKYETPDGITVLGGKTGTTTAAGSCLVLLSQGPSGTKYISVVLAATSHDQLYKLMSEIISTEQ